MDAHDPTDPLAPALPRLAASVRLGRAPARDWAGAIRNLPGVPADEREWFGAEAWLDALGRAPVGREDVLGRLSGLAPALRVAEVAPGGWRHADQLPDGEGRDGYRELLVILDRNPRSPAAFRDHHWDDQPGVLMHLRLVRSGSFLKLAELQSEWHQRGARGLRVEDPQAFRDAAEARRREAEDDIERLMAAGEGAAFVGEVSRILGGRGDGGRRVAWSALNGNDCGPAVAAALDAARPRLGPVLAAFGARWDACLDIMRALQAVPLAPMRASWPRVGLRLAMALAAEGGHDGLVLPSGDEVAEALGTDEAIHSLSWRLLPDGRVEVSPVTMDVNASRSSRPPEVSVPGELEDLLGDAEAAEAILEEVAAGRSAGEIDDDWFAARQEVIWPNRGLRRFYDSHLTRVLADEGRRAGADVLGGGAILRHTAASRAAWAAPAIGAWEPPPQDWEMAPEPGPGAR